MRVAAAIATLVSASLLPVAMAEDWNSFVIRGTPTIISSPTQTEFLITASGQKAGLGTSLADGSRLDGILALSIVRMDDTTRFTTAGPAVAPYFNIWITNGAGKYAVIANEPSNAEWAGGQQWNMTWDTLKTKTLKVYENDDKSWLPNAGVGLTFEDLAAFTVKAPSSAELTAGWAGLGTGAPRQLNTNAAFGVNWVFGDTLSNYVSGDPGYIVSSPSISLATPLGVPEPATLGVLALGAAVVLTRRRKAAR